MTDLTQKELAEWLRLAKQNRNNLKWFEKQKLDRLNFRIMNLSNNINILGQEK